MVVNRKSLFLIRLLSDVLLLNIAFFLAAILAQSWNILIERYYMFFLLIGLNLLWIITTSYFNFYDDLFSRNFPVQFANIIKISLLQVATTILFIFLWKENLFTRYFIIYYAVLLIVLVSLRVIISRKTLKHLRNKGKNIRNMLIVGDGILAQNFKQLIQSNPDFGYNLKGMIEEKNILSADYFSSSFETMLSSGVDEVVIALSEASRQLTDKILQVCDKYAVKVHIIPDYFRFVSKKFQVTMFGNFPIVTVRNDPLAEAQWRFIKRLFDIIFSLFVILFLLSWLIPLLALFVKLFSRGSVFYSQTRVGMKNKTFKFYKFRTLVPADESKKETYSPVVDGDERITSIGRFLRRTNLDELPQFINVLKGDMSVVGPRPHFTPYDEVYSEIVDEIKLRSRVRPGLTGWAQVHGLRGDLPDPVENKKRTRKRIEYDIWYIENWSIWLDFHIIFLTVWQMLKGETRAV